MSTYVATLIFYDWTFKPQDTNKILRIQRFARREHLPVVEDKLENTAGTPHYLSAGEFQENEIPFSCQMCEHRYTLRVSANNSVRMHGLVSLLEAYASYCDIHSRVYTIGEFE